MHKRNRWLAVLPYCAAGTLLFVALPGAANASSPGKPATAKAAAARRTTTTTKKAPPSPAPARTPVLGSQAFVKAHGIGWGKYEPHTVFNGRTQAGLVLEIAWTGWGSATATGNGKGYVLVTKPKQHAVLVPVQLRATQLGHCSQGGPLAYQHLLSREPSKPGGPMGNWSAWTGTKTIC
jgi:hypothetical protein